MAANSAELTEDDFVNIGNSACCNEDESCILLPELVEHILSKLPMKSLNSCSSVCRQWHDIAQRIKQRRNQIGWLFYDGESGQTVDEIVACIETLSMEPKRAIVFCSSDLHDSSVRVPSSRMPSARHPRAAKQEKLSLIDYLTRVLPPGCDVKGVATEGIVGTEWKSHQFVEQESGKAASCLLLPELDGVDVYNFSIGSNIDQLLTGNSGQMPDPATLTAITGIPSDKQVKVVLFFHVMRFSRMDSDLGYALLKHYDQVVVAGGYVDQLLPEIPLADTEQDEPIVQGLAFCGSKIKMASVLLRTGVKTRANVETALRRLQAAHVPATHRIAFMFACVGRGQHFYKEKNVESEVFKKLFPGTPLFGFFGNGETGYDYLPDYSSAAGDIGYTVIGASVEDPAEGSEEDSWKWELPEIHHFYTTVFVLISLS